MNPAAGKDQWPSVHIALIKLGSIARHAEELIGADGHAFDAEAIRSLLQDPDVVEAMAALDRNALLPVRRS